MCQMLLRYPTLSTELVEGSFYAICHNPRERIFDVIISFRIKEFFGVFEKDAR